MANNKQILDKLARNLGQLGITSTRGSDLSVSAAGLVISYDFATIGAPMGGVDNTVSPFLGIGTANPGQLHIVTGANISASFGTLAKLQVLASCASFSNDINVVGLDATIRLRGHADLIGMGQ